MAAYNAEVRARFFEDVTAELDHAYAKHGADLWGRHEFYGVLAEEVDEVWDAIKKDLPLDDVYKEAVQVAAMCLRFFETGDRYGENDDTGEAQERKRAERWGKDWPR